VLGVRLGVGPELGRGGRGGERGAEVGEQVGHAGKLGGGRERHPHGAFPDWRARLAPPRGVLDVADRLERAGFETWCVGGAIRDAVLGHPSLDWDLATAARPAEVQRLFRRTVPKGIAFGTVGVFDRAGVLHEVTTFRRDVRTDGRHARSSSGRRSTTTWRARLHHQRGRVPPRDRRARRPVRRARRPGAPRRPCRGRPARADARGPAPRAPGDPLRRALRLRHRAGDLGRGVRQRAAPRPAVARARREELDKTMRQVARPSWALERWRESGALAALVPPLAAQPAEAFAAADCLPLPSLERRPQRLANRMAAPWLGLDRATVERGLTALRASKQEVRWAADLAERWERIAPALRDALADDAAAPPADALLRRWAAVTGRTLAAGGAARGGGAVRGRAGGGPPRAVGPGRAAPCTAGWCAWRTATPSSSPTSR
jgi:tRNA nucleotidyltransferase (CCA-adding enzyme)